MRQLCFFVACLFASLFGFSQPVVKSFSPLYGPVGSTVVINGSSFSSTAINNTVYFGGAKAVVQEATDTTLAVKVPAGATYQPITVTTNGLTASSRLPFTVTFSGNTDPFTVNSFLPKTDIPTGIYPHSLCVADFNNDGKADILVCKGSSNNVTILPNTSANGSLSFANALNLPAAGNNHEGSATGDLDGDGKLDFVITNTFGQNSISLYRNTSNNGAINFASKVDYPVDNGPYSVAIGDLNGDGKQDIAVANNGSEKICVYLNQSTPGKFLLSTRKDYDAGTYPYSLAICDLDGDGKNDLVFTTQGSGSALSAMQNATVDSLAFQQPSIYATFPGPFVVAIGDLNGDEKPDVAAASSGGNAVMVLQNASANGSISFVSQDYFSSGAYPTCVAIHDMNGDGKPDLVTANNSANSVSVLQNNSTGNSLAFAAPVDLPVNAYPLFVALGDLDGDERPDIIAANSSEENISIYRNIVGSITTPVIQSFTPTSGINGTAVKISGANFTGTTAVRFGGIPAASYTVDSDTGITAIVGEGASGDVSVTTANGTATKMGFIFEGPIIQSFTPTTGVQGTVVTITGVNFSTATSVKFGGTEAASFTVVSSTSISAVVGDGASGDVSVTTGKGTATRSGFSFGAPVITSITPLAGAVGTTVTISGQNFSTAPSENAVFFGGVKATVTSATASKLTTIVPSGALYSPITVTTNHLTAYSSLPFMPVFAADSLTITSSSFSLNGSYGTGNYPVAVRLCDLNNDGKPDAITANSLGNNISVFKNNSTPGSPFLSNKINFETGADPKQIATGDLDGDGKLDLVVSNFNAGQTSTVTVYRNTSTADNIDFAGKGNLSSGSGTLGVAIADMNGDGKPDVVTSSGNSGFVSVFQNTTNTPGEISFAPRTDFRILSHADQLTVADLDRDGRPEIITSNFAGKSASVFRNVSVGGNLSVEGPIDFAVGNHPSYITTGDLDSDGKLEVIVSNYSSGTISILKNNCVPGIISFAAAQDLTIGASNIVVSDLNGDGKPDLFIGRGLNGKVSVLQNTFSGGGFSFGDPVDFTIGDYDTFVAAGDVDGDGKPELAAVTTTLNTLRVLQNTISNPAISTLSVTAAESGVSITITGSRFTNTSSVKFGGVEADSFEVVSPTRINAVVGGGASGDVTITTPFGIAKYSGFQFIPIVTAKGPTTFCSDGFVALRSSAIANNQWYREGQIINAATDTIYLASASGNYTVKTTSNGITTTSSNSIAVVKTIVPTPVITQSGNALVSSAVAGNQWYINGTTIAGATAQTYQPTQEGNYTVIVSQSGCTSNASAPFVFKTTGVLNLGNDQYIKLYPNPVKDNLYLQWKLNGIRAINLRITDEYGREVQTFQNVPSQKKITISALPQGIYFIRFYDDQRKINGTLLFIKAN